MKDEIYCTIKVILIVLGLFAFCIIAHESYHYFSINGEATGVCFGKCPLGDAYEGMIDDSWAVSGVHWNISVVELDKLDLGKEEYNAWTFSIILTMILILTLFYLEVSE